MIDYNEGYEAVARQFQDQGIPVDQPGFYDHPNFVKVEQQIPTYLNNYARFVATRTYTEEYLGRAQREIPLIAGSFHRELCVDGRLGACVDASGYLSRMLEREGFWNFMVKGSLTIDFPARSKIPRGYFWFMDEGDFVAGHAWLHAPPFVVLDVTVRQQPYRGKQREHLPDLVLADDSEPAEGSADDIMSPELRQYLTRRGVRPARHLVTVEPELPKFLQVFPASLVRARYTRLKYVPVAVTAPDLPLEQMRSMTFSDRTGGQVYTGVIQPMLAETRAAPADAQGR